MTLDYRFDLFDRKMQDLTQQMEDLQAEVKKLKALHNECLKGTEDFLACCKKYKIKKVAINTMDDSIDGCSGFSFGPNNSVFAEGNFDGWPAIWKVCEETGIGGGCGNHNQHQIKRDAKLIDGVYELKNGTWRRKED